MTEPPPITDTITFELYYGVSSPWALLGAPEAERIAKKYGLTIHLKPITVIPENGGIPLKSRHGARQAYHALDLYRYAKFLGVPMKAKPKYYPQPPGGIELAGQAIIRVQKAFGIGSPQALAFSYAIQRCIWVTEEGDHCDVQVLRKLAKDVGIDEKAIESCVVDRRGLRDDEAVKEWNANHDEAVHKGKSAVGIFGTPNYVINGEIFWGQDRLFMLEIRVKELLEAGAKPVLY
ncbi:thioredoxin-like protein [Naematelia encephala]|uniref:Glutathione S-transferase kappa n=1 Tax=Naematelia encephala TaxID=71784 RepID=A0A1Y2B3B8_9TREE|nr:thioredoxin-like protein [Naematelia encephala]